MRDMRKFFKRDFNKITKYTLRKRHRKDLFYKHSLHYYLEERYPLLFNQKFLNKSDMVKFTENQNHVLFLGTFLYAKDACFKLFKDSDEDAPQSMKA